MLSVSSVITQCQQENAMLQLYETAMGATSCGIVISDATHPDLPVIYCNPAFERITGYSKSEVVGRNCRMLQGADTDQAALSQIRTSVREGRECQVVLKNYRKNGVPFWNELRISPVRDATGTLTHFIGVQTDITERVLAQEQAQLMQFSLARAGDAAFWITPKARFFYVNDAACRLLGYEREELLALTVQDIDPDFPNATWLQPWEAIKQKGSFTIETSYRAKHNRIFPVEVTLNYLEFNGQEYYCAFARDISERKQAEADLQRSYAVLKAQQEASIAGILFIDENRKVASYNHRFCQMWQVPQELIESGEEQQLRDYLQTDLQHPQDFVAQWEELSADASTVCQGEIYLKDGRVFDHYTAPVMSPQGDFYGRMWYFRDFTGRKLAEAKLRSAAEREQIVGAIATRIRSSLNLQEVLNTAVTEVRQILHTDRVVLYRFEPDWSGTVVVESVGNGWKSVLGSKIKDHCFAEKYVVAYKKGRIQTVEDIHNGGLQQCHIDLLSRFQVRANLVLPVLQGDQLWGLLVAHHCRGPRQWQESEVRMLKQLSVHLAIALQQAELYQHIQTELVERRAAEEALRQSETRLLQQKAHLQNTLQQLKKTQAQLIQSEKMSSLGQLVAGVAHEINNPVTFITGNLNHASHYTQDLLHLLQLYRLHYPQPTPQIQATADYIDLDFLIQDFPKLLDSMQVGADRIREIVTSLRSFSRLDEAERKPVDIHEGIDNTLMILQHRLKPHAHHAGIQVIKSYGHLPKVECYAGQLNQVFMNLLSNAIDALQESEAKNWGLEIGDSESQIPTINIYTEVLEGISKDPANEARVVIRIADNGIGIPEAIQNRIFDPFFTTKPVGKGTGLGLSICYQIVVEKHGGELRCCSVPGQGTEFIIELPLQQAANDTVPMLMAVMQEQVA